MELVRPIAFAQQGTRRLTRVKTDRKETGTARGRKTGCAALYCTVACRLCTIIDMTICVHAIDMTISAVVGAKLLERLFSAVQLDHSPALRTQ